jgi:LDH2 family malate/lactate/ureidoglycolate dehydrogenase
LSGTASSATPAVDDEGVAARVQVGDLDRLLERALARRGVPAEHRRLVVDGLLGTSLRGVDTHGVRLFPTYLAELDGGRARPRPALAWSGQGRAARRLDAGGALGLVAGTLAAREAARLAGEHGVGAVAVADSNHFGAASVYTLEMARLGRLGLAFTNSDALVAPHAGSRPFFGTNPLSLAVEGDGGEVLCIDMATSQVSYSRVKKAREAGAAIERGWAVTAAGRDAADQPAASDLALRPLGGHKGQCLNLMVEVLCALLVGEPFDHELSHLFVPPFDAPRRVAHLFVAFDLAAFTDPAGFRARLARLLAALREQPAAGGEPVLAPGDLEAAAAAERRVHGIPLDADELARLRAVDAEAPAAERVGL